MQLQLEVRRRLDPHETGAVADLVGAVERATGARPLDDQHWLELMAGGRDGFVAVLGRAGENGAVRAYAQASHANESWSVQLVFDPTQPELLAETGEALLRATLDGVADAGGGRVHWWVTEPGEVHHRIADAVGLRDARQLYQLRVPLPLPGPRLDLATRPFVVGQDEERWLQVNNRAFADHPEQGGWDLETLRLREREPWFDPAGFLLYEEDGRLAAFCWTKVHADHDPPLGEIYVIAADPDFHGRGLGRALTVAGLESLADRGITVGMLYVDGENTAAMGLYRSLGFTTHHVDHAFVADVPAATATRDR